MASRAEDGHACEAVERVRALRTAGQHPDAVAAGVANVEGASRGDGYTKRVVEARGSTRPLQEPQLPACHSGDSAKWSDHAHAAVQAVSHKEVSTGCHSKMLWLVEGGQGASTIRPSATGTAS